MDRNCMGPQHLGGCRTNLPKCEFCIETRLSMCRMRKQLVRAFHCLSVVPLQHDICSKLTNYNRLQVPRRLHGAGRRAVHRVRTWLIQGHNRLRRLHRLQRIVLLPVRRGQRRNYAYTPCAKCDERLRDTKLVYNDRRRPYHTTSHVPSVRSWRLHI